jgi:polar amino acid transport system substrate-binding protein
MRRLHVPLFVALALAVAACGSSDSGSATTASTSAAAQKSAGPACDNASLELKSPGKLTIGTDKPAYPPYFEDDDPTNGKGFESAVAYAVAQQLGFAQTEVSWVVVPFNSSYAPGPKKFDFDINQIPSSWARCSRSSASSRPTA